MMKLIRAILEKRSVAATAVAVGLVSIAGCGADGTAREQAARTTTAVDPTTVTSTTSTDDGYIDAARCFRDLGARTASSAADLSFA
jgi:hypothetical protein